MFGKNYFIRMNQTEFHCWVWENIYEIDSLKLIKFPNATCERGIFEINPFARIN